MAHPGRAGAAWIVPAICAALLLAAVYGETRTASGMLADPEVLANVPLSLGFAVVGALIVSPATRGNRLGLALPRLGDGHGDGVLRLSSTPGTAW